MRNGNAIHIWILSVLTWLVPQANQYSTMEK